MSLSAVWEPYSNVAYGIDRYSNDDLDGQSTGGELNCDLCETDDYEGGTDYESDWGDNHMDMDYFLPPYEMNMTHLENIKLHLYLLLKDGRLCGNGFQKLKDTTIYIFDIDANIALEGHTDTINTIIQLEDDRICSCSHDKTIKIWDIESGECDQTLIGHAHVVHCLIQLKNGQICSGSYDKTIKVWNIDTGACELTIKMDFYLVCLVQLTNGSVCSGGYSGIIKVWNSTTGLSEKTFSHHSNVNSIIVLDKNRICSCSHDTTIKIWNTSSGVCERTLYGHSDYVTGISLLLDGNLCSVSKDGTAKIWRIDRDMCVLSIDVDSCSGLNRVMQLHDGKVLLVNNYYNRVYLLEKQ